MRFCVFKICRAGSYRRNIEAGSMPPKEAAFLSFVGVTKDGL